MKRSYIYGIILLVSALFIGIGTGVAALEFSNFTTLDYRDAATQLPNETLEHEVQLYPGQPLSIDNYWGQVTVQTDNTLGDTAKISVTAPKGLFRLHWERYGPQANSNTFWINIDTDPFQTAKLFMQYLKDDYIISYFPEVEIIITVNETYAKDFSNHHGYFPEGYEASLRYDEMSSNYEEQLENISTNYEEQLNSQRENFEQQLQNKEDNLIQMQEDYAAQIENYEDQLEQLRTQLDQRADQ